MVSEEKDGAWDPPSPGFTKGDALSKDEIHEKTIRQARENPRVAEEIWEIYRLHPEVSDEEIDDALKGCIIERWKQQHGLPLDRSLGNPVTHWLYLCGRIGPERGRFPLTSATRS